MEFSTTELSAMDGSFGYFGRSGLQEIGMLALINRPNFAVIRDDRTTS